MTGSGGDADSWLLLAAAREGDPESLAALYRIYATDVRRYIQTRVANRHLAEDFTSEVFVRILRSLGSVSHQEGKFRGWLITISRNIVIDHFKSRYNRSEIPVSVLPELGRFEVSAEQAVLRRQLCELVWNGLARLVPDQRDCLRMRFLEGRTVAETAAVLGRSEAAVRQLQHRAMRKLEDLLEPQEISA
ncbi:MAG TPA: sigma-70 family RNA polymerase sigma factor [Amycolatopsis sp.]|nr:sigma-70 family RNA polymerase sigma factor [Amycolatopsis sp.]